MFLSTSPVIIHFILLIMLSIRQRNKFESTNKKNCQYHWVNHGEWESALFIVSTLFLSAHVWFCKIEHINCIICLYQYSRGTLLLWQLDVIVAQFHEMTTDFKKTKQFMNKQPNKIFREHACIQINEIQRTVTYNRCPCSFPYLQRVNEMLRV